MQQASSGNEQQLIIIYLFANTRAGHLRAGDVM